MGQPEERVDPRRVFPPAESIIVAALGYGPSLPADFPEEGLRGRVAGFAVGVDYHRALGDKLRLLAERVRDETGANFALAVDATPLLEKALARRSGLGFFGENGLIYLRDKGSFFVLGEILIDKRLDPDEVLRLDCGGCGLCVASCPTGALERPYELNPHLCVSYLTQRGGFIPRELRTKLGNFIYGCDVCQEVCPLNRLSTEVEAGPVDRAFPVLTDLLTPGAIRRRYGSSALGWRSPSTIIRNVVIALGNLGAEEAVCSLVQCLDSRSPVVRAHTAWALGRIGGKQAREALSCAWHRELDPVVKEELELALEGR